MSGQESRLWLQNVDDESRIIGPLLQKRLISASCWHLARNYRHSHCNEGWLIFPFIEPKNQNIQKILLFQKNHHR